MNYLTDNEVENLRELRSLFYKTTDEETRDQIRSTFFNIVFPEGVSAGTLGCQVVRRNNGVGSSIREARIKRGLTQNALSYQTQIPQSHLSKIENGQHNPNQATLKKIMDALGHE